MNKTNRRETFVTTQLIMEKERDRTARRRRRGETACSHSSQEGAASSTDVEVKVTKGSISAFVFIPFYN